ARQLAGERGEEIVRTMRRGRASAWAMITRTAVFDELILRTIERESVDLVVNLAAGLDARAFRLALPATLRWVDVDLPDILRYKRERLGDARPSCRYEAVPTDLTDPAARRALFARLGAGSHRALVVTEGLLVYLTSEQVGTLAADLHAVPSFRWWLIDLASPGLLKLMKRSWGDALERGNAPFRFGPAEHVAFFEPFGWRAAEWRSTLEEARRLRREMPGAWLWRILGRFSSQRKRDEWRRFSSYVLLQRTDGASA
ncbi:MAG TPA: class I SAM-dependent methyltransferase, partial [Gemmatimonadaceae bacterium]|nr:class I SAM-dependent methyltransferase [Gemmatimonadaceae bacterium]